MRNRLWQHVKDVRRVEDFKSDVIFEAMPIADAKVSGNVGELMAAALAAVGVLPAVIGGATPCETDYLAAQGATFPAVSREVLEDFNRRTMFPVMDEAAEMRRYRMIAEFFS
jgi:hypothetical protein